MRELELVLVEAGHVDLAPDLGVAGLARGVDRGLVLAEVDEGRGEAGPVGDGGEEQAGGLVHAGLEDLLARGELIGHVGHGEEVLHVVQPVRLGVRDGELRVDLRLAQRLAGHLQVPDQVVVLAGPTGRLDHLGVVGRVVGLDVRFCRRQSWSA